MCDEVIDFEGLFLVRLEIKLPLPLLFFSVHWCYAGGTEMAMRCNGIIGPSPLQVGWLVLPAQLLASRGSRHLATYVSG